MRTRHTYWRYMARDYLRLLLDDRWYWCRHCHRPVEHEMASLPHGDPDKKVLTCLDCGYADSEVVSIGHEHDSNTDRRGSD